MFREKVTEKDINLSQNMLRKDKIRKIRLNRADMEHCIKALSEIGVKIA